MYRVKFSLPPAQTADAARELCVTVIGQPSVVKVYPADALETDVWEFGDSDTVMAVLWPIGADGSHGEPTKLFQFAVADGKATEASDKVGIAEIVAPEAESPVETAPEPPAP